MIKKSGLLVDRLQSNVCFWICITAIWTTITFNAAGAAPNICDRLVFESDLCYPKK